ncbi:MAG: hypothetical protein AAGA48_16220 [Myxococcota bacterium]
MLGLTTGCFEHFERLETHVAYQSTTQRFAVERRLVNIGPALLGCDTVDNCVAAFDRVLDPSQTIRPDRMALSDKMMRRLRDSGAEQIEISFEPTLSSLDVVVRYEATVGTEAADDTGVLAEWSGRRGRGRYRLVVDAEPSMAPPSHATTRRHARKTPDGLVWVDQWVLPARRRSVTVNTPVGEAESLFTQIPGLRGAMVERGWLEALP